MLFLMVSFTYVVSEQTIVNLLNLFIEMSVYKP